ncbi:putative porin [Sphingomonas sp. MG17]|uniref:Porin n=1 Tax=Sphingomonas tagetis TaxID=2949092 RepID=A0A9X2KKW6_9SPHN|nr:putative porin [Sphingomonas tagetis]MCP3730929.1 putative porin [Sphingomonas tagetis]
MRFVLLAAAALSAASPALAQDPRLDTLERRLTEQQQRIQQLESLVAEQAALLKQVRAERAAAPVAPPPMAVAAALAAPSVAVVAAVPAATGPFRIPGLDVGGDLRVRQELNVSAADARDRGRSVLRARIRAAYTIAPGLTVGAQLATGDPDDPNSTDVTLGSFLDDLNVSLDQAWLRYTHGGLTAYAGKFPNIFQRTDMVWDGDVVPQGLGAVYAADLGGGAKLDARAIYFVIDEAQAARDSDMLGGQIVAAVPLSPALKATLAGGYYHYRLDSVGGADSGDFRSNLIVGGRYRSDFHLLNGIAALAWSGASPRWPVTFTADYVKNLGAAVSADSGFNLELAAGRTAQKGDWRIAYNYSEVGVDAVFAAFSHDNTNIATNYQLHGFGLAYVPVKDVVLDLVLYHYKPLDALYTGTNQPNDWLDRIRLNFLVNF